MRLFVGRRQGRHVREVQIQPANEPLLQIPFYPRRLLTPLRPLHGITCRPREDGPRYEPCAPGERPFPNRNSPSAAVKILPIAREMQKSVYTHTCIHPACNLSYSRSSPIRRVVGSWRRSGQASAPCTRSWKPWTFSNRASRGTFASFTRQGSCACGRRGKSASTRCARSHSASWTNGCDNTAACGRPASTGSAPSSIGDRRRGQENAGRRTHDKQPEDREGQGGEHRAKDHHVPDIQRSGRGSREALCLDLQELQDPRAGARGGGRSDRERAGAERDVRTRRSAVHGHGRRPVFHVRARDVPTKGKTATSARVSRPKIRFERTFQASAKEVWELWTTKEGLESWWGPEGFTTKVHKLDLRPGGEFEYAMTATRQDLIEGMKAMGLPLTSVARGTYTEVTRPRRLAYSTLADFIPGVAPYEVAALVEIQPLGSGVRMGVTGEAVRDDVRSEGAT